MPSMSTEMKIFRGRVWAWLTSVRRTRAIETRCIRGHIVPRSTSVAPIDRPGRFEYNRDPHAPDTEADDSLARPGRSGVRHRAWRRARGSEPRRHARAHD